jgi:hypothetical protein
VKNVIVVVNIIAVIVSGECSPCDDSWLSQPTVVAAVTVYDTPIPQSMEGVELAERIVDNACPWERITHVRGDGDSDGERGQKVAAVSKGMMVL